MVEPLQSVEVGVVVERRKAASHWIDFVWRPVSILPGRPDAAPWTVLASDGDCTTFGDVLRGARPHRSQHHLRQGTAGRAS
jgi:hypothetical protein